MGEVPQIIYEERIVEVPTVHDIETVTTVPKFNVKEVPKQVAKVQLQAHEVLLEKPVQIFQEVPQEVPEVMTAELLVQQPRIEVEYFDKEVPVVVIEPKEIIEEVGSLSSRDAFVSSALPRPSERVAASSTFAPSARSRPVVLQPSSKSVPVAVPTMRGGAVVKPLAAERIS